MYSVFQEIILDELRDSTRYFEFDDETIEIVVKSLLAVHATYMSVCKELDDLVETDEDYRKQAVEAKSKMPAWFPYKWVSSDKNHHPIYWKAIRVYYAGDE